MFEYMVSWVDENGARHTIGTEELDLALSCFWEFLRAGFSADIGSAITGEVFAYRTEFDTYIADGWDLILLDYLMREAWGE